MTFSSLLLIAGLAAMFRERVFGQALSSGHLSGFGFKPGANSEKGYFVFARRFAAGEVRLRNRGGKFYLDGTAFEVRTVGQLRKLYEGLTGEKL